MKRCGQKMSTKVETGFRPVRQGAEGAAQPAGARLPFTAETLQTGRVNVKAFNSVEAEPTPALPNRSPTINRPKYRVARLCNDTVERAENNLLRKASGSRLQPLRLPMACVTPDCNG